MSKRALITGISGQDGSYLAELLLSKGYEVFGLIRRSSYPSVHRIEHILDQITALSADLTDQPSLEAALRASRPDEVYNLAAQSHVPSSFAQPVLTGDVTGVGVTRLLDSIKNFDPSIRFYQASTSEMFGRAKTAPQDENTPFHPRSPYGAAKVYAHWIAVNYRESFNMNVSCGILFNHESPRRSPEFVTRKVTQTAARIRLGLETELRMGNLDPQRDWGFAGDYVEAMWSMLQHEPDDFVIASGRMHTIRDLLDVAFGHLDLNWQDYVVQDDRFMRPTESDLLMGDFSKARQTLGWEPKTSFEMMIENMVEYDYEQEKLKIGN